MQDAKKHIARTMGFAKSSIPDGVTPPDANEDTCPLCGHFMPLDVRGYCGREECGEAAVEKARKIARDKGGDVPGLYYRFGDQEIVILSKLECWEEPKQRKHPDMCTQGECTDWALPADYLCRHHRLTENREKYLASNRAPRKPRKSKGKGKKRYRKSDRMPGNKIRGLDKFK